MSTDMDAHGYIEEATQTLFEGSPRRAEANALIAIAMLLETATDHLAYLAVKLAEQSEPDVMVSNGNYNTGEACTCARCGQNHPEAYDGWRERWQRNIDADVADARESSLTDVPFPQEHPARTLFPGQQAFTTEAPHPYRHFDSGPR